MNEETTTIKVEARDLRVGDAIVTRFPDTAWNISWIGQERRGGRVKTLTGLGVRTYFPSTEVEVIRKES